MAKTPLRSSSDMFTQGLSCPTSENLPCILDHQGAVEVKAPGCLQIPLLLKQNGDVKIRPGALHVSETQFVQDLIRYCHPAGDWPTEPGKPLLWNDGTRERKIWFSRNLDGDPNAVRLRVDDSNWYYPDFLLWILDEAEKTQTLGFVDPKGMQMGMPAGWHEPKVINTVYTPHEIESALDERPVRDRDGAQWRFRFRGLLVSTTALSKARELGVFRVAAPSGGTATPSEAAFEKARIIFKSGHDGDTGYIGRVLSRLIHDNPFDEDMRRFAEAYADPSGYQPDSAAAYEAAIRVREHGDKSCCDILGDYIRTALGGSEDYRTAVFRNRLNDLQNAQERGGLLRRMRGALNEIQPEEAPKEYWNTVLNDTP